MTKNLCTLNGVLNSYDQVNENLELDISDDEVFTKPEEVWNKIMDEIEDNPEKQKLYNDAIKGGK